MNETMKDEQIHNELAETADVSTNHQTDQLKEEATIEPTVAEDEIVNFAKEQGLIDDHTESEIASESGEEEEIQELTEDEKEYIMASIEAILFMSNKPVSLSRLKSLIDSEIKTSNFRICMNELKNEFSKNFRGVEIASISGGYQLRTKPHMSTVLRNMVKTQPIKLTSTAMETLAVIAYKQPITKDEIDRIRGVDSGYMIRNLLEKRMIKISGRSEMPGKPMLYSTSHEFLELFNLKDESSLPSIHEIEAMVAASEIGDEDQVDKQFEDFGNMVRTQNANLFIEGGLDKDIEDIRTQIAEIPVTTPFIEEQKRKEKIQISLSAKSLSEEKRIELENELNEIIANETARFETAKQQVQDIITDTQMNDAVLQDTHTTLSVNTESTMDNIILPDALDDSNEPSPEM